MENKYTVHIQYTVHIHWKNRSIDTLANVENATNTSDGRLVIVHIANGQRIKKDYNQQYLNENLFYWESVQELKEWELKE